MRDRFIAPLMVHRDVNERVGNGTLSPVQYKAIIPEKEVEAGKRGCLVAVLECLRFRYGDRKQRRLSDHIRTFTVGCLLGAIERAFQYLGAQERAGGESP